LNDRLVAWAVGPRDRVTAARLRDKLAERGACSWPPDAHAAYRGVLPPRKHVVGEAHHTGGIERHNARTRHWSARFRRRSIVVSRPARRVEATLALRAFLDHHDGDPSALTLLT
jgi:insertion element IS1 protein InsB